MEALGINLGLLIVQIIAFIIVFLTLNAWVYQPLLNMMETRKQKIAQGLEDARVAAEARADAEKQAPSLFLKLLSGKPLDGQEVFLFKSAVLLNLGRMYHGKGWVQQFHLGALRNNNTRKLRELGPDTGFDSIGEFPQARLMGQFFDFLDNSNQLAKTIVYNLNPADNELFATMMGNFNDGSVPGKMQFGSGWWFLDQKDGMEKQMTALSNMGLLSRFVGMVTDSRSFLSFPRHEYFRRILCNLLGNDIEKGELPDVPQVGTMVEDVCYGNARRFFGF
jgi:glucuronate isomerase